MNIPVVIPEPGFYVHYKHEPEGDLYNYIYEVVGVARNTEDKTFSVLYRPLYKNDWFAPASYQSRPLDMFLEDVEKDGVKMSRFKYITDPVLISELTVTRNDMYGMQ
jgi:hypothetical protein